jgi:hypothetical protein
MGVMVKRSLFLECYWLVYFSTCYWLDEPRSRLSGLSEMRAATGTTIIPRFINVVAFLLGW